MIISYFNYLWDIHGISAGSAIKGREFVEALRRLGHEVHLEWRSSQPKQSTSNQTDPENSRNPALQKFLKEPKRYMVNFKYLIQEYQILKRQTPDIFFPRLSYGNFSGLLLSKWLDLPMVVEADCPTTYEWEAFYSKDAFKIGNLSMRVELANLKHADAVITQSKQLTEYYINHGIEPEKIHTIPNAADVNKFQPQDRDEKIMEKYNLKNKIVIGWIGAGVSWTGIDILNETMHKLMKQYPSLMCLMLGSKKNMDFFRNHFQGNGYADRFVLPGFVPHEEIPKYLSCMDIVLAPYPQLDFFYASSMKLFEYMAAGKAIVATRIGQIADVIEEGKNGFLFDSETPGELYEKVHKLILSEDLRKKFGRNARLDAEETWNWDSVAKKMVTVFEDVLNKKNSRKNNKSIYSL